MIKNITKIIGLFVLLGFISCNSAEEKTFSKIVEVDGSKIKISIDTFNFKSNSEIEKVVEYKDRYFSIFKESRFKGKPSFKQKKIFVFNNRGTLKQEIELPWETKKLRLYKLRVEGDSLFFIKNNGVRGTDFKTDFKNWNFKKKTLKEKPLYEDDRYEVYSLCYGEWGGTVFFKDKLSEDIYETSSTCVDIVNRINGEYYITNYMGHMNGSASVLKISNPQKLKVSEDIEKVFKRNLDEHIAKSSYKGTEILLDTFGFRIQESFVLDNKLMHIYYSDKGTFIGKIEKGKMTPTYKFDFKFLPKHHQSTKDGKHILSFITEEELTNGILVIENNNIDFHFTR